MSKTQGGATAQFSWDAGAGLPLLLADSTASYVYGPGGQILEQIAGSTPTYYHSDQLGSVRALTDQSGALVATDAYGQPTASTGSAPNPFRYAGQYRDSESGLYYLRDRFPAPSRTLPRFGAHVSRASLRILPHPWARPALSRRRCVSMLR
jgi:uncharacterized protein RhaS with RHS repeats